MSAAKDMVVEFPFGRSAHKDARPASHGDHVQGRDLNVQSTSERKRYDFIQRTRAQWAAGENQGV